MSVEPLPYGRHCVDDDDIAAVVRVLSGDALTGGPEVARFEEDFEAAVGSAHAVASSSGTAALHLAALAFEAGPGTSVVVPSITFLASATPFTLNGATVVFCDVDPANGLMTADHLEAAISRASDPVRVVVPVHLGGRAAPLREISKVARARGALVVEDACHALGSMYRDRPVGSCDWSDMAIFSTHAVKTIASGEGGLTTTNDEAIAKKIELLRSHAMTRDPEDFVGELAFESEGVPNPWYYEIRQPSLNYRATDIQCALGRSQLAKLGRFVKRRRELAARYDELLKGELEGLVVPNADSPDCVPALHIYAVRINFEEMGVFRGELMKRLRERGVGTQVHYIPVHRQPFYAARGEDDLPGADAYYNSTLTLPLFPMMTDGDVERVVDALRASLFQNQ
jgi:UDP-4-amino-4,6-dideoxy-N-acetyl-beta-L-altrosamine transaminase